ncbi:MAG TPA: TIGR02594 family protein [Ohtaekwangia sp.]|uniref:C40 family peptidase n=1 Tax=Ohtaekwangia sp. TaxID=2066019 RepID=UPI002F958160
MDSIIKIAVAELGQKEVPGAGNNAAIVRYAQESGFTNINNDETSWCSIFLNWCAKKAGLRGTGKADARSWLLAGQRVDNNPEPGDIVVFWRENINSWKGHVGIFFGFSKDNTRVYCLGGNQGNQVSISAFPVANVLGFRRLATSTVMVLPDKALRPGSTGDDVKILQNALKLAGFDCGTSDGIFGTRTEAAVKALQSTRVNLPISGIFDVATRLYLLEVLNQ